MFHSVAINQMGNLHFHRGDQCIRKEAGRNDSMMSWVMLGLIEASHGKMTKDNMHESTLMKWALTQIDLYFVNMLCFILY